MYIQDIHIISYFIIGIVGLIVGQLIDWCNQRLPEYKKVFSKEIFTQYFKHFKPNYLLGIITAVMYIALLYTFGFSIDFVKFALLIPMLLSAFVIDYRLQIIPNRLTITIFEVGLLFTFLGVIVNTNVGINTFFNNFLGMLLGAGIFALITFIGGLIAGKEAMGFGDVKLMGALGLFFGWANILIISVLSFLLAAVISIGILFMKKKKMNEYIPFGPFIVLSSFIVIFTPANLLVMLVFKIFTLGLYQG